MTFNAVDHGRGTEGISVESENVLIKCSCSMSTFIKLSMVEEMRPEYQSAFVLKPVNLETC